MEAQDDTRPKPMTLTIQLVGEPLKNPAMQTFQIQCATTWPLVTLCQVIESEFASKNPGESLEVYCLIKSSNPGLRLNYNLPIITYFQEGESVSAQFELVDNTPPKTDDEKLPVTLLTGFLGAGKTTLLNHILHVQNERKYFVIQNEFGEVSIDSDLVSDAMKQSTTTEMISLDNGCMCCAVRGDLNKAFEDILAGVKNKTIDVEGIIIETTGMADPRPVVATFNKVPGIDDEMRLDCIVTVVAANHIEMQLARQEVDGINEAIEQVIAADRIILNKTDLLPSSQVQQVKNTIRSLNPYARLYPATKCQIDLNKILNVSAFSLEKWATDDSIFEVAPVVEEEEVKPKHVHGHGHGKKEHGHGHGKEEHGHGHDEEEHGHGHKEEHGHGHGKKEHGHGHGHKEEHGHHGHDDHDDMSEDCVEENCTNEDHNHGHDHGHSHDDCHEEECTDPSHNHDHGHSHGAPAASTITPHSSGISSVGIQIPGEVNMHRFQMFFRSLDEESMYRTKGILKIQGEPRKFIFHGIHDNMDTHLSEHEWPSDGVAVNKLVFIGKNLERTALEEAFQKCIVPPNASANM